MKKKFILEGLDCANCAAKMEEGIKKLDGVNDASVNFLTTKMVIDAEDEKMAEIIVQAEKLIKGLESQVIMKKAQAGSACGYRLFIRKKETWILKRQPFISKNI